MRKILLCLSLFLPSLHAAPQKKPLFEERQNLFINNRVLLKVDGKPISVMDVARKMDLIFYRQFPELASSAMARYQFYLSGWESMLSAVIDDHLIVADAKEKKVEVSEGEVREELEKLFGPDVVFNLDKLGLSLDEAIELLKMELTVQKMNGVMVRSKAIAEVHPKSIRERYEQMIKKNPPQNSWVYRVVSIRGKEHAQTAKEVFNRLNESASFEEALALIPRKEECEISVSDDYAREESAVSLAHKAILQTLSVGGYSEPISTNSVSRIFYLKEYRKAAAIPFNEVAEKLKQELTQEITAKYNDEYRLKLRKQYGMTESYLKKVIPNKFEPFMLR